MKYEPVFLPLMRDPLPDTADRVRRDVLSIEFAIPQIQRLKYVGESRVFRIEDEERECP